MRRDEMDSMVDFIIGPNGSRVGVNSQILGLTRDQFLELAELARLGASVAEPREEEIERMARAIHDADSARHTIWPLGPNDTGQRDVDCWARLCLNCDTHREEARAALLALKDNNEIQS